MPFMETKRRVCPPAAADLQYSKATEIRYRRSEADIGDTDGGATLPASRHGFFCIATIGEATKESSNTSQAAFAACSAAIPCPEPVDDHQGDDRAGADHG